MCSNKFYGFPLLLFYFHWCWLVTPGCMTCKVRSCRCKFVAVVVSCNTIVCSRHSKSCKIFFSDLTCNAFHAGFTLESVSVSFVAAVKHNCVLYHHIPHFHTGLLFPRHHPRISHFNQWEATYDFLSANHISVILLTVSFPISRTRFVFWDDQLFKSSKPFV